MRALSVLAWWSIIAASPPWLHADFDQVIALSSSVRPEYVRATDPNGRPRPEGYVFSPGHFFGGLTRDSSVEKMDFMTVARTLAPQLAKQAYFPAGDAANADLVVIVHWGVTSIHEDPQRTFEIADLGAALNAYNANIAQAGIADPAALNSQLDQLDASMDNTRSAINYNAALLGYTRSLRRERAQVYPTEAELTLNMELNEERYFVILMAYDNRLLLKEHKAKLLWVTRLSVRSPGNNFTESLPALAQAGGQVFGRPVDGLMHVDATWKRGEVTLGEMKIVGVEEPPPSPPSK
ncbi:MAG TPA: hypothetical protein VHD61_04095 [Lacunisphaera sp.]|nr:hypothetical protein [Lacunisphaera sp.]